MDEISNKGDMQFKSELSEPNKAGGPLAMLAGFLLGSFVYGFFAVILMILIIGGDTELFGWPGVLPLCLPLVLSAIRFVRKKPGVVSMTGGFLIASIIYFPGPMFVLIANISSSQ